jgi:hypothetical protein
MVSMMKFLGVMIVLSNTKSIRQNTFKAFKIHRLASSRAVRYFSEVGFNVLSKGVMLLDPFSDH